MAKIKTEQPALSPANVKEAAAEYLRDKGYTSYVKDGVVLTVVESETTFKDVTKLLKDWGYHASYGTTKGDRNERES